MAMRRRLPWILGLLVTGCGDPVITSFGDPPDDPAEDDYCAPWDESCKTPEEDPCGESGACDPPDEENEDEDEDEDEDCGNFICLDNGNPSCDPGTQDCPEGEKCTAYVMTPGYCCVDANKCVPIIGDKQFGDTCLRGLDNDDCGEGLFCMTKTSGDVGDGVCIAMCDISNPDSCDERGAIGGICVPFCDGTLPQCYVTCDPLAQDCPEPRGCYAAGGIGFVCTLPGYDDGKGNDDDDCYTIQSCMPGLLCAAGHGQVGCESDACCTPFCECEPSTPEGINSPECPTEGEQCVCYYTEQAPPEFERVGLCYLPED